MKPSTTKTRIAEVSTSIRHLKSLRREPKQPRWTATEIEAFMRLKVEATVLCACQARSRGKTHLRNFPYGPFRNEVKFLEHIDSLITDIVNTVDTEEVAVAKAA